MSVETSGDVVVSEGDGGGTDSAGSALAHYPDSTVESPPQQNEQKPPRPPKAALPLEDRLKKAEGALQRHKENSSRIYQQYKEVESKYTRQQEEFSRLQQQLQQMEQLKMRIAEGDLDALAELGGSFDTFVQRQLDPEAVRTARAAQKGLSETEKKLQALEAKLAQREEMERQQAVNQEINTFLQIASGPDFPDIQLLKPEAAVELAKEVAPALKESLGRVPTFREIAAEVNAQVGAYHRQVYEAYQRRLSAQTPPTAPQQPPRKPPVAPSTIPQKAATQKAAGSPKLSPQERRMLALKKLQEANRED